MNGRPIRLSSSAACAACVPRERSPGRSASVCCGGVFGPAMRRRWKRSSETCTCPMHHFQTQNLHVHMPHDLPRAKLTRARTVSTCPRAKFARTHTSCIISIRKICTCTCPMLHFKTQNLHVHARYPPFPHATFARTRELSNANHRAICTTTFATASIWSLCHVRMQNLHVHMAHAPCPHAKFARAHPPGRISKRKICTCTRACHHFTTQNLHAHGS